MDHRFGGEAADQKLFTTPYDGLNKQPILVPLDIDALAELVVGQNYGTIRFLAALVRALEKRNPVPTDKVSALTHRLRRVVAQYLE